MHIVSSWLCCVCVRVFVQCMCMCMCELDGWCGDDCFHALAVQFLYVHKERCSTLCLDLLVLDCVKFVMKLIFKGVLPNIRNEA